MEETKMKDQLNRQINVGDEVCYATRKRNDTNLKLGKVIEVYDDYIELISYNNDGPEWWCPTKDYSLKNNSKRTIHNRHTILIIKQIDMK